MKSTFVERGRRRGRVQLVLAVATAAGAAALAAGAGGGCGMIRSISSGRAPSVSDVDEARRVGKDVKDVGMSAAEAMKSLTPENEYFIGRSVATNILAKYDYAYLDKGSDWESGSVSDLTAYVNQIGAALGALVIAEPDGGDRIAPLAGYHFVILDTDVPNAFSAPGGFVFVSKGAVQLTHTEDELACVLAHEVAHVAKGHGLKAIKKSRWGGVSKKILSKAATYTPAEIGALTDAFSGAMDDMVDSLLTSGYAPGIEFEADEYGVEIAARAGYDPTAMTAFLGRLDDWAKKSGEGFAKTHPPASERLEKLDKKLKKLAKKYAMGDPAARKGRYKKAMMEL
jgi:predicted Zn-dependent protease